VNVLGTVSNLDDIFLFFDIFIVDICLEGIPKAPVKHVYKRRGNKPEAEVTKAINKSPLESV
jgi:hypothetical protein